MTEPEERPDLPLRAPASTDPAGAPPAQAASAAGAEPGADLKQALERGARAFDQRAQALGREAEAAVTRWGENPAVRETADVATRVWGLVLLGFGLWFFADVTLGLDVPSVAWRDLWPAVLIALGAVIVLRGMTRRG